MGRTTRRELKIVILLTLAITFMDISGLPAVLLIRVRLWDVSPFIFPLLVNFGLIGLLAFLVLRYLCPNWKLGFRRKNLWAGLKRYGWAGAAAGLLSAAAFCAGLYPFDYKPTVWKVLFEGILYYIGVGIVEELYVRGLFLNAVEKLAERSRNKTQIAIVISSVVFGLGHIPGLIGMGAFVIIFKLLSTIGMGLYFGTIYRKTENLWVPAIMHALIDICALPYCFTTFSGFADISLYLLLVIYGLLGGYSIFIMRKKED